jgi:hypothetical protein
VGVSEGPTFRDVVAQQLLWARWWLMACYLYYHRNVSLFRDEDFDRLTQLMQEHTRWRDGLHSYLIDDGMLMVGSGYNLKLEDYPRRCIAAADQFVLEHGVPLQ